MLKQKQHFTRLIFCIINLTTEVRRVVVKSYIELALMYGSESRTISRLFRNYVEAADQGMTGQPAIDLATRINKENIS